MLSRMEVAEMKRLAEERRREKAEDRMARQKVKEQIARDRDERAACDSKPVPQVTVDLSKEPITPNTKREYSTCRLQVYIKHASDDSSTLIGL